MIPDSVPHRPGAAPSPPPEPVGTEGHWMHELRNELSTAMMSAAAARRLLQDGNTDEAVVNLRRAEAACFRCAQLLNPAHGMRPQ